MEINENPILVGDSIIFRDEDGTFVYGQNQKRISWVKNWNNETFQKLKEQGFFSPLAKTIVSPENRRFSNIMLLLGRGCPLGCRYCYANAGTTRELMSKDIADRAISLYLSKNPVNPRVTLFGGGEPTLNIHTIKYIIEKYKERVRWVLTTCGVLPPVFLKWLIDNGVVITFSIDGPPEIQNFLRPLKDGSPSSMLVERSMRIWLEKSQKPLSVRTTLTEDTVDQIDNILNYFSGIGVKTIHFEPLYNLGRATESVKDGSLKQFSGEKWARTTIKILKWAKENQKRIKIGELGYFSNPGIDSYCGPMCGKTIVVNHKGMLTACSEVVDETFPEWNLFCVGDCESEFHVDRPKLDCLADRISSKMISCQNCFAKYLCKGGCAHKGWAVTNDLFVPDPNHCEFMKTIIPLLVKKIATQSE